MEQQKEITRIDLARQLILHCQYDDAFEQLELAETENPEDYEVNYELGRLYYEMGDYYAAIANYEIVLENQQSAIIYFNLGCAYEANDECDKAMGAYFKSISINEKFPFSYKKLGMLFMARKDFKDAIEYFEDYLKLDVAEDEKESVKKIILRISAQDSQKST